MKNSILCLLSIVLLNCSNSDDTSTHTVESNKVLLLKVDFTTAMLEGAKQLSFEDNNSDFTIASDYDAPGDFGNIRLYYEQLDQLIFDGSIIWAGTGEMSYPDDFTSPDDLDVMDTPLDVPSNTLFENVMYDDYAYYPENIDYALLWDAIDQLELVSEYRTDNPNSPISVFLYTPSVGIGNPLEWDYFIILKN